MRNIFVFLLSIFTVSLSVRAQDLVITGAKVYPSPDVPPIGNATVLIHAGKIAAVGKRVAVPAGTPTLQCHNCVVFAGFWNCHVHFTEAKWLNASSQPAEKLTGQLQQMLSGSGFTTVVDTGSDPGNTIPLRHRIESGEVKGPYIYTAGVPLYPPHAVPFYVQDLPAEILARLPQPSSPAEAEAAVQSNITAGSDIVKLFTGSYVARGHVVPMPLPVATIAVEAGHRQGQLVFAHPSNLEGVRVALESGVDVLAHAPDTVDGVDILLLHQLVAHHVSMIPTLKLFSGESDIEKVRDIVAAFHRIGGQLIFGTDTGFLTDYDITEEYRQLALAGLTYRDVLAMLTTAPAERFKVSDRKGRVAAGMDADLTVLSADPAAGDMTAFTHVQCTIRDGMIIDSTP
jgi:imidazolonepropionase-like amidohydrolase